MTTTQWTGKNYRITFLTERLVRLEYQSEGRFEDRPTTAVQCRDFPPVEVEARRFPGRVEMDTACLHLSYDEKPFSPEGLSLSVKGGLSAYMSDWRYGQSLSTLGGTARTLDQADGEIPVGDGLISRNGFSVLDDSRSMILREDGALRPRDYAEQDLYFFGYGHDYAACLRDFYRLSGAAPLLPRWALGNWWSRFFRYTEHSYLALMEQFAAKNVPLSVAVIDMDWHLTDVLYGSGWTGYTWNQELFPDPPRFLRALHDRGMHVTLNLHPAGGVQPHEAAYESVCRALGRDASEKQCVDFDAADETFLRAYLECLHHPLEKEGVDFWWIDWQQGNTSAIPGLDPLWVLNELHYRDNCRDGKRGLILSRYAGPGSQRCPVGFSGDSIMSWKSLAFQPRFTAMAANAGYPWWSHDIGGHMNGVRDDELSVRWLQLGVFSPILRLHSSCSPFTGKEPWSYGLEAELAMEDALRLRHRLLPYLYTAMERTFRLGEALVRPLYYRWPENPEAYSVPDQYLFGPSLMVCAVTQPMDARLKRASVTAWLPEGYWFDFTTGQIYTGGRLMKLWRALDEYPVLAPAGAIVPLSEDPRADRLPAELTLRLFAGADGEIELYEDDGESIRSESARTLVRFSWETSELTLQAAGALRLLPPSRTWHVEAVGFVPTEVRLDGETMETSYDPARNAVCWTAELPTDETPHTFHLERCTVAEDDWKRRAEKRLQAMQTSNDEKEAVWRLLNQKKRSASLLGTLRLTAQTPGMAECLEECVFAQDESGLEPQGEEKS